MSDNCSFIDTNNQGNEAESNKRNGDDEVSGSTGSEEKISTSDGVASIASEKEQKDGPPSKRVKLNPGKEPVVVDVCDTMGMSPNQRVEVKWELISDHDGTTESRWWGAKLLPHDGTSFHTLSDDEDTADAVRVPVRILDYDPYVAGGFEERDQHKVVFLNTHSLLDLGSNQPMWFRQEGSSWDEKMEENSDPSTVSNSSNVNEEAVLSVLDAVLKQALENSGMGKKMMSMSAAQQCYMADRIVKTKKKLLNKLITNHDGNEITSDLVRQCMAEIGTEGV